MCVCGGGGGAAALAAPVRAHPPPTRCRLKNCPTAAEAEAAEDEDSPSEPTSWTGGPSPQLRPAGQEIERVCTAPQGTIVLLRFSRGAVADP